MNNPSIEHPDISTLTDEQLHAKIRETQDLIIQNCELSSHILDLKIRELHYMHEEKERRKAVTDG